MREKDTPMPIDPHIEDYLDHIVAPLVGLAPYEERQQLRAELRTHLEALVEAHEEIGTAPAEAVRTALAQFGDPRAVARQWAREWQRTSRPGQVESARPATLVALGCFGLAAGATLALFAALQAGGSRFGESARTLYLLWCLGSPMLAGLATGFLASARHALGTFYANAMLVLVMALISLWLAPGSTEGGLVSVTLTLFQACLCTPVGCATAAFGGWLQRRREERPRPWGLPA